MIVLLNIEQAAAISSGKAWTWCHQRIQIHFPIPVLWKAEDLWEFETTEGLICIKSADAPELARDRI